MIRYLCGAMLALASTVLQAQAIDFNLGDKSMEFRYIVDSGSRLGGTELDAGMLYTSDNDLLAMAGMLVMGDTGSGTPGLHAGIGFKMFGITSTPRDVAALAVGGQLHLAPVSLPRSGFFIRGYYAPDIVTFLDADSMRYLAIGAEYEIVAKGSVYVGYRNTEASLSGTGRMKINDDIHVGMTMRF
ncbi:MAG: hypothetical protein HY940_09560 [Gammaproteobacteria bacterium]|nr:hypothetical protein [Gammaproteobacteria bacterium]